jgi:YD repeat-containing protein
MTDANSNQTAFTYDAFGRVTQTNSPSSLSENYHILAGYKYSPHPMRQLIGTASR